jgi:hypothetical protein
MTPIIGDIITTVGNLASDLITTEKETRQLDIDEYNAETKRLESQTEINKVEAASGSLFVAGWRPFIGWVCGLAFGYATIFEPLLRFGSAVWFDYAGTFPVIDTTLTMQALFGILGLGAMRSFDKVKGATK